MVYIRLPGVVKSVSDVCS